MDVFDRAQAADSVFLAQALAVHARKTLPPSSKVSKTHCIDCDCTIPKRRREAIPGCTRCVACEQKNETLRRR